jgi:hypothetical protein
LWSFPSLNEIGRCSESSAKDDSLIPADRVQGRFLELVHVMTTVYSQQATPLWVVVILTSQVKSVRDMISRVGIHNVPHRGGLELLLQST